MTKKNDKAKKPVEVNVKANDKEIHVKRDESGLEASYEGKNVDVEIKNTPEEKKFKYDGKKLDIEIEKTKEGTTVTVDAKNGILQTIGKFISRIVLRRLK